LFKLYKDYSIKKEFKNQIFITIQYD